jgi:hypothetical protein
LTLTAVVEVDVALDVEPIVDLYVDQRSRFFDEDSETTRRSMYKVEVGVDVHVAVQVNVLRQRQRRPQRLRKAGCAALITLRVMDCGLGNDVEHSHATTGPTDPTPAPRVFVFADMRGNASTARVVGREVCP